MIVSAQAAASATETTSSPASSAFFAFAEPGRSYHSGGTFPMHRSPGRLETDVLGQFPALPNVHFIDASVFPSIPATTITLTVMANAHRIATQAEP